ncbi:hypothetical protein GCM10011509_12150 [Ornithinimicrobium pekingense]|uniref:TOMM leader peptide-binding protein n=1 Tax=Ornithinimicrobium pekingense TaxID=384677 RepID=A0ABQ2F6A6_9MICO|nr:hypothetical protein GCM10011509_12150 [Ornithinimicrobium pekingense]
MTVLRRPGGELQVGVGPGAVMLDPGPAVQPDGTGEELGPVLAGALATRGRETGGGPEPPPACAVLGAGSLAGRLRRVLGNVPTESHAGVLVVVHQQVVPLEVGVALARSGTPTVPVVTQHRRVVVGPVVGPGGGPCLHCLDLHRRDKDPAWPALATALGHPAEQVVGPDVPDALARAVEGVVLLLVSAVQGGRPVSPGLGYELGPDAPHVVARRWTAHPACPWHR